MSGPVCPDCGLLALKESGGDNMKCPICGWEGNNFLRMTLMPGMGPDLWEETQEKLAMKQSGKLFYVRVDLKGKDDKKFNATFDMMDIFNVTEISGSGRLIFHVPEKPTKE
jgi:hypothetical protein